MSPAALQLRAAELRRAGRDTAAAEVEHYAGHRALADDLAAFVARTERRYLEIDPCLAGTVSGECRVCRSSISTAQLPADHPLVIATALRVSARGKRSAAAESICELNAKHLRALADDLDAEATRIEGRIS